MIFLWRSNLDFFSTFGWETVKDLLLKRIEMMLHGGRGDHGRCSDNSVYVGFFFLNVCVTHIASFQLRCDDDETKTTCKKNRFLDL